MPDRGMVIMQRRRDFDIRRRKRLRKHSPRGESLLSLRGGKRRTLVRGEEGGGVAET